MRRLILESSEVAKFRDPTQPHFRERDVELALEIDSVPLAIRVAREDGLLVARPVCA